MKFGFLAATMLTFSGTGVYAQSIRGTTDAGRVEQRLNIRSMPRAIQPQAIDVSSDAASAAPQGAENMMLTLASLNLEGMTAYPSAEIEALYADKIGQRISLADVYAIAAAITAKYRNEGYILTQVVIPPQTIESGNVTMRVVEGFVDNVTVEGQLSEYEAKIVNGYADYIRKGGVSNIKDMEQAMLLINDLPGITARSVLAPSPTVVGGAEMKIFVERTPYDGQVGFDTYGSEFLGESQLSAAFATNALLGLGERIGVEAVYAPGRSLTKELAYGNISYDQPVGPWGTIVHIMGSQAFTEPGDTLHVFNINGRSTYGELRVEQPVIRTRALSFKLSAQLDARNTETTSNIDIERIDNIRAFRLGADLDFTDTLLGVGINSVAFKASKGLDIFGASDEGDAGLSRALGDPQFTKYELEIQRLQRLVNSLNLLVSVKGQHSSDALLSSEEFGVGGSSYGRGYDPSEIVGEQGIAGKLELQWNNPFENTFFDGYQLFGFYDAGRIWNKDATTSGEKIDSLASTGIGVRGTFLYGTNLEAFWALPLTTDVGSRTSQTPRAAIKIARPF
ncbi:MAG: ShlB/FhaC/HecB family hemolysin secretion/activation protein [Proteobacteria bacterium]|nr:ShlB/FhaC/HecB family hemolysin secretion/activation protein [Pseudomonadota bacterium]